VVIKVTDNGVGIDPANIDKLFGMDISFTTKGTSKENGTGLGLILCKELVEMQGGKIWVESEKDAGSSFYFTLPSAC
jgi:signal transduction histidine kinase